MNIATVRRIAQVFFLLLFFWFCWVTTLGVHWWELDGWPVNWLPGSHCNVQIVHSRKLFQ